ncbi:MAG: PH domain-containing protein [Myxococcota bacterium]
MEPFEQLDRAVIGYWRLVAAPRVASLLAPLSLAGVLVFFESRTAGLVVLALAGTLALLSVGWGLLVAPLRYRRFRFRLTGGLLELHDGVLIHRQKIIPVDRMQHLDVEAGPLERLFGLTSLHVFTAGGSGATFSLPGLHPARAQALRAALLARRGQAS